MNLSNSTLYLLTSILIVSCNYRQASEEEVLNDIFPQLVDSLSIGSTNLIPAAPPLIHDTDSNYVAIDTIAGYEILAERLKLIQQIDSIDSRIIIGLEDSCFSFNFNDIVGREDFESSTIVEQFQDIEGSDLMPRKLDLDKIYPSPNFQILSQTDLRNEYENFWDIGDRKFGGIIAISKIKFSKDLRTGLLLFETYPFRNEGAGYIVLVKLVDGKWRVKRIETNWIT